jgi:hypothetical protein
MQCMSNFRLAVCLFTLLPYFVFSEEDYKLDKIFGYIYLDVTGKCREFEDLRQVKCNYVIINTFTFSWLLLKL